MFVVKRKSDIEWDVVEERGLRERVIDTWPTEAIALIRMRDLNARSAQDVMGSFGLFSVVSDGNPKEKCTCVTGFAVDAVPCPIHG